MTADDTEYLHYMVCPYFADNQNVLWSSSNTNVAIVNATSGLVTAKNAGTVTIYANSQDGSGVKGSCYVTVKEYIPVKSVNFYGEKVYTTVGEGFKMDVTVSPANASNKTLVWHSSNENVAAIDYFSDYVYAVRSGEATITATSVDGNITATCTFIAIQTLTGADSYIDDEDIKNTIIKFKTASDCIELTYLNNEISEEQNNKQQLALEKAINIARSDYAIMHPQSNFIYQYFKGRNRNSDDISPFLRDSYSYPNNGYNDSKDELAITIIQRSLELLGYFEPPNEYEYGTFDEETKAALLSSPYYMANNNDFQKYSYYAMLGSNTANVRTKENIKILHKMRLFHNEVAEWVAKKVPDGRTKETTIYKKADHSKWGFADVMKTGTLNEYIWEVKPWKQKYRVLNSLAVAQLNSYIHVWNNVEQNYRLQLVALAGYNIGKFAFKSVYTGQIIVVESNSAIPPDNRSGLVHYYPTEDDREYEEEYSEEYSLEDSPMPAPIPAYRRDFGKTYDIGNLQIAGFAEIMGLAVLVVIVAGVAYFCPASLAFAII